MQHTILPKSKARYSGGSAAGKTEPRAIRFREVCLAAEPKGVFAVRMFQNSLRLFAAVCCFAISLWGQETTGTISGTVTDPSGALVANVELTVVNVGTSATFKTTSTSSGDFVLRTLPVGTYRLTAVAPGFKRFEASNL